jgi:hypothetical protein
MANDTERQGENEELIDRLTTEKRTRSNENVRTNNSEEWDHDHALMRHHAARAILMELGEHSPPGAIVEKDFMERQILRTFLANHAWRPSLGLRLNGGNVKWANAVDWARKDLGDEKLLMRATDVPGSGYQLLAGAEHLARNALHEQEVQALRNLHEQADYSRKIMRKRVETEVEDCNAIYIMFDPKRPDRCKIGAGNGDCKARETEARLWTDGEAKIVHVEHIGSGYARKAEESARKQLGFKGHRVNGEWVHCKWSFAKPILEALGRQARDQLAKGQGPTWNAAVRTASGILERGGRDEPRQSPQNPPVRSAGAEPFG